MKPKTTMILIALLLACVAYVLIVHTSLFRSNNKTPAVEEKAVLAISPAATSRLVVSAADGSRIVFAKEGDSWRMVEPVAAKADPLAVKGILEALAGLKSVRAFGPGDKDAVGSDITGLDSPLWTVVVTDSSGAARTLRVGRPVPLGGGQTYVRPENDKKTYVVTLDLAAVLSRPSAVFRDKTMLDVQADDVERVVVDGREKYQLVRTGEEWGIVSPTFSAPADAQKAGSFLAKLSHVTAKTLIADAPKSLAPYGLEKPRLTVEVTLKARPAAKSPATASAPATQPGKTYAISFGNPTDKDVFARLAGEPAVFQLDASLLNDLQPAPADLRDKLVVRTDPAAVSGLEIITPAGKAKLAKSSYGLWQMEEPAVGGANAEMVSRLLNAIQSIRAESFKDGEEAVLSSGMDKPRSQITLRSEGKNEGVTLIVGAATPSGEMAFVKTASGSSVAVVKAADVEPLLADPANYWNPSLLRVPAAEKPVQLKLVRPDGSAALAAGSDGAWRLTEPGAVAGAADAAAVQAVLAELCDLRATKVVSLDKTVPARFAQAKDAVAVTLTTEIPPVRPAAPSRPASTPASASAPASAPASMPSSAPVRKTYALRIVKLDKNAYAWVEGEPTVAVGEFPLSLYDSLVAEMRDRKVFSLAAEDVERIRLTAGDKKLEFAREKSEWHYVSDPYVKIDAVKVNAFVKDVLEIQATQFLAGPAADAAKAALAKPAVAMEITLAKGATDSLSIAAGGPAGTTDRYACITVTQEAPSSGGNRPPQPAATTSQRHLILPAVVVQKLDKSLKDFLKSADDQNPQTPRNPQNPDEDHSLPVMD